MTAIDQLIADMQELKKTKLYASSFKAIDDCIFLANYHKKEEEKQSEQYAFFSILSDRRSLKPICFMDYIKLMNK